MATEKPLTPEEWPDIHDWFIQQISLSGGTFQYTIAYTGDKEIVVDRLIIVTPDITGSKAVSLAYDDDSATVDSGSVFLIGTDSEGVDLESGGPTIIVPSDNSVVPRNKHLNLELSGTGTAGTSLFQVAYRTKRK